MKNKMFIVVFIGLLVTPLSVMGIGLGVSVQGNWGMISLPVSATGMLIEPFVDYHRREGYDRGSNDDWNYSSYGIGLGLFSRTLAASDTALYYGARVSYFHQEERQDHRSTYVWNRSLKQDGYSIAPTIGLEYRLTDNVSLAAEGLVSYSELSGTSSLTQSYLPTESGKVKNTSVSTSELAILRIYF